MGRSGKRLGKFSAIAIFVFVLAFIGRTSTAAEEFKLRDVIHSDLKLKVEWDDGWAEKLNRDKLLLEEIVDINGNELLLISGARAYVKSAKVDKNGAKAIELSKITNLEGLLKEVETFDSSASIKKLDPTKEFWLLNNRFYRYTIENLKDISKAKEITSPENKVRWKHSAFFSKRYTELFNSGRLSDANRKIARSQLDKMFLVVTEAAASTKNKVEANKKENTALVPSSPKEKSADKFEHINTIASPGQLRIVFNTGDRMYDVELAGIAKLKNNELTTIFGTRFPVVEIAVYDFHGTQLKLDLSRNPDMKDVFEQLSKVYSGLRWKELNPREQIGYIKTQLDLIASSLENDMRQSSQNELTAFFFEEMLNSAEERVKVLSSWEEFSKTEKENHKVFGKVHVKTLDRYFEAVKNNPKALSNQQAEPGEQTVNYFEKFVSRDVTEQACLLYTSPSPRDATLSRMPSSA